MSACACGAYAYLEVVYVNISKSTVACPFALDLGSLSSERTFDSTKFGIIF